MSSIPSGELITYVIAAYYRDVLTPRWMCKSSQEGRGIWDIAYDWRYAEQFFSKTRAKNVLKSVGAKRMKGKGYRFIVLEMTASYETRKVWPIAPLEELAQQAGK